MNDKKYIIDDNENVISTYNHIANEYYRLRESLILEDEINYLVTRTPSNGLILDAGCGNGRDAEIFAKSGKHIVAIDYSQGQIDIARRRLENNKHVEVHFEDIRNLVFSSNMFDGIWCCAVLPHFNNLTIKKILMDFYKFLKPGGIAILTFKKGEREEMVVESEFNGITRYTNFHNQNQIIDFITNAGFTLCDISDYNERKRFGDSHRDIDFIIVTITKK